MLRDVALVGLCAFASCAGSAPRAEEPAPRILATDQEPFGIDAAATPEQMRAHLEEGLTQKELKFVGFDDVTISECVDHLVAATLDARRRPDDPRVRARLSEWTGLYRAARREAVVRRTAGAASCLPGR